MLDPHSNNRETPSRWQAGVFQLKARGLQVRRGLIELGSRPNRHARGKRLADAEVVAEMRSPLWREMSAAEFPLTAGKVENLRLSARRFHGVEVPAGEVLSFWRQLGRTTRAKGFTDGRELREGCVVPAVGGGLCQLSGLIYQAALKAGLEIVERHAHSRIIPGSAAEQNLDATVFWNYVDLRMRAETDWRIEVELTAADIIVRIRSGRRIPETVVTTSKEDSRQAPSGDCLTCGMISCFRHPSATASHAPGLGHSSFLLDARSPEFDEWCRGHAREGDHWLLPLDGRRWKKANYQWSTPSGAVLRYATVATLLRSLKQRRLPAQGAKRQQQLMDGEAALAKCYAKLLDPGCRHVVVSQNLLPHLWRLGALGGRSFDVLIERWPMDELQRRLDLAKAAHPASPTLSDFRADEDIIAAEREALSAAARLITPHRAIAEYFGDQAWRIDWQVPTPLKHQPANEPTVFFPASRLGRKGAYELAAVLNERPEVQLLHLGRATEGAADPFEGVSCRQAGADALATAHVLILPAWVEHQPRLALLALASGIPVIATKDCGLPEHPLLRILPIPDVAELQKVMTEVLSG